jgi:hypothetical protein
MSAWSIGAGTGLPPAIARDVVGDEAVADTPTAADAPTVDKLLAWIPGDVIAAYMALVLALQGADAEMVEPTSGWWLIGAIAAAGVLTFLGGFANPINLDGGDWRELLVKSLILSPIAFTLWSLVLPGSWWQSVDTLANNAPVVAIVAGISAAAFGLLAQGVVALVNRPT